MANLRALVKRRKAIRNIRKITRTMELIATARFKKALDRAQEADAYTKKIAELAADLGRSGGEASHPLLEVRPTTGKAVLLVVTSNRGLCGGYNASILREGVARVREWTGAKLPFDLELSGKRSFSFFRFQGYKATQSFTQFDDKPSFELVENLLANRFIEMFIKGEIDRLDVAYMKFLNPARQRPVVETLLPLASMADAPAGTGGSVDYEFIPNASEILSELVPVAFKVKLFKCFLDAAVGEQIARRIAMKQATESAGDLIKSISRKYNRARQANITKEISELIAGAEALK
jgi:F-type H+-transporting ATPase subunit gamma